MGFVCFVVCQMSDKLTEIMAWKRREIAPSLRAVSEAELARLDAAAPVGAAVGDRYPTAMMGSLDG